MNYPGMRDEIAEEFAGLSNAFRFEHGFHVHDPVKVARNLVKWRAENPLKAQAQYQRHAAKKAITTKAWKQANVERVREHRRRYREKLRARKAAR